ncbi:MAG: hypothetical protein IT378_15795 [Sandaracinaceae bacterium]|nr:hypothetical protein [Sandaracinaceae bacterium]
MDFIEIPDPLEGERAAALVPAPAPLVDAAWARARMFTGRTVSATALDREQLVREGGVRLLGRALRPGIVMGLRAEATDDDAGRRRRVTIEPGYGVCASGEDVVVTSAMNANVIALGVETTRSLPIEGPDHTPPTLADALAHWRDNGPPVPPPADVPPPEDGSDMGAFGRLPFPAVLVLEPVVIDEVPPEGFGPDTNPCERDPQAEPFEDWRYVDAARLRWVPLSVLLDELDLDAGAWLAQALGSRRTLDAYRNGLAFGLFELESRIDAPMPWERRAVPIALCALDAESNILFLDRSAVARRGGRASAPAPLPSEPALWQARIEALAEHLSAFTLVPEVPLAARLRHLPPAGVLPKALFDLALRRTRAFPATWGISAAPVPLDALDPILRRVAGLSPYDLDRTTGDEVKLLVPVPAAAWDPGLLQIATVHPDIHDAMLYTHASLRVTAERRGELRAKVAALYGALGGASAIPPYEIETDEAALAERVIRSVLWDSDAAIGLFARIAAAAGGPILADVAALADALNALLRDGATPVPTSGEVHLLAQAFFAAGVSGPVAVAPYVRSTVRPVPIPPVPLPVPPDRVLPGEPALPGRPGLPTDLIPRIDIPGITRPILKRDAELESGPGFELEGGWAIPELVTHDHDLAVARDAMLYLVAGTLETEALDRASALQARSQVLLLAADISAIAREDLASLFVRQRRRPPLVGVLRGGTAADRARRIEDIAARFGAREGSGTPPEFSLRIEASAVADRDRIVLVGPAVAGADVSARVSDARGELEAAATDEAAREAGVRLSILEGTGAILFCADALDARTGLSRRVRAARAAAILRGLRRAERTAETSAEDLLLLAAGAGEGSFGTVVLEHGLSVQIVEDLAGRLRAMTTPPGTLRVVSEAEIQLLATGGVAGLIAILEEKIDRAEDAVDFGFMMVQSATFRAREHLLGRDAAQRMAASPLLSDLADVIHPNIDANQLQKFFDDVKNEPAPQPPPGGGSIVPWFDRALRYSAPKDVIFAAAGGFATTDPFIGIIEPRLPLPEPPPTPSVPAPGGPTPSVPEPGTVLPPRDRGAIDPTRILPGASVGGPRITTPRVSGMPSVARIAEPLLEAVAVGTAAATFDVLSTPTYAAGKAARAPSVTVARIVAATKEMRAREPVGFALRKTGVAKRIEDARAVELRAEAFRLRAAITQTIAGLDLHLEGVLFPGFLAPAVEGELRKSVSLALTPERVQQVLRGEHDLQTADADPPGLVSDAIRSLETSAAMLRVVEGRIREVREAVLLCKRAQLHIERSILAAEAREPVIERALDEARHDLSVAAALLEEERERVAAINERRRGVLERDVPFVVFHRAREVDATDALPIHDVEPVLTASPALAALSRPAPPAPEELREIVDLFRDAPANWLREVHPLFAQIDAVKPLRAVLGDGALRAQSLLATSFATPEPLIGRRGLELASALVGVRRAAVLPLRHAAAAISSATLDRLTWRQAHEVALDTLSVADLLGHRLVPPRISSAAAAVIDGIYKVAAHIYAEVGLIAPRIRLAWAQRISEHDRPIDLSDLAVLPFWADVGTSADDHADPFRKRELTSMVGWLFSRIEPSRAEARALMNDVLRVAILLASHAPVGRIVQGHVMEPTPVAPDKPIRVRIDPALVRVGMSAIVTVGGTATLRAIVEDLADLHVVARVVSVPQPGLTLASGEAVRFVEADSSPIQASPSRPLVKPRVQLVR